MSNQEIYINIQGVLVKVSVQNVQLASQWYSEKLGFQEIFKFGDTWARLAIPNNSVTIGLSKDGHPTNSGGEVTTFIVPDIKTAKLDLESKGVTVGPIEDAGAGVYLAFFNDLDGNSLGLRQEQSSNS